MKFTDLPLNENILKALGEKNFSELFEIQEKSIPFLLENETDFVGQAQTGTGKTAAFSLPLLSKIGESFNHIQVPYLSAHQRTCHTDSRRIKTILQIHRYKNVCRLRRNTYSGPNKRIKRKKPQILVGTPGRVLDLISRGVVQLNKTQYAVCDECDEMLNRGFIEDVQEILSLLSGNRHIWMFSATMPKPVLKVVQEFLDAPKMVSVQRKSLSSQNIEQGYYLVPRNNKVKALCSLFDSLEDFYGMIFCKTKN